MDRWIDCSRWIASGGLVDRLHQVDRWIGRSDKYLVMNGSRWIGG